MIERADADGDGVVSEEEFYNLITKKAHWFNILGILAFLLIYRLFYIISTIHSFGNSLT